MKKKISIFFSDFAIFFGEIYLYQGRLRMQSFIIVAQVTYDREILPCVIYSSYGALGKNLSYREEKSIFFKAMKKEVLKDFFFRGEEKNTKAGKEFGIK